MSRKIYTFEVVDANGKPVKRFTHSCTNLGAQDRAQRLLRKTPHAAAAFGCSSDGRSVHSAYRC